MLFLIYAVALILILVVPALVWFITASAPATLIVAGVIFVIYLMILAAMALSES